MAFVLCELSWILIPDLRLETQLARAAAALKLLVALGASLEQACLSAASYCRVGGQSSLVRCHGSIVRRALQRVVRSGLLEG